MADEGVDVWALDEVKFEQHGSRCRMWVPPEIKEPFVMHQPTRKSIGYYGAVRLRDGKFVYRREFDNFTGDTFASFLKYLRKINAANKRKVVLIIDNVKYHHAKSHAQWRYTVQQRLSLEFMPPYSPELNPIERVWKLARRKATHNQYFQSLDKLITEVEAVFDQWKMPNKVLQKLCAIN